MQKATTESYGDPSRGYSLTVDHRQFGVLCAGDCSGALALLEQRLDGSKFQVHTVGSAAEVVSELDRRPPDIVFLDADCMHLSGVELCRTIKEHPSTMLLPVVVLSGSTKQRLPAFTAGADDFITLPVAPEEFVARIEALARAGTARRNAASAQLTTEIKRREDIRQTFRRYVSPRLADKILSDAELRDNIVTPELRTRAVVMFADLRGFTAISERLSPHEVVPLLNEFFSLLTEITFRHGGTVFHMAGDCLMVGFGVPLEQPDSPERAVRAAREMLDRFAVLAEEWKKKHQIETGLGIGINEGDVVAGNVGSATFMNYTIIGDAVNVASRLCQRARAGEVIFSSTVKRSLEARGLKLDALELPPMTLRGRSTPIDIYCVPLAKRLDLGEPPDPA
jgi:class 3 adenylate cyclase